MWKSCLCVTEVLQSFQADFCRAEKTVAKQPQNGQGLMRTGMKSFGMGVHNGMACGFGREDPELHMPGRWVTHGILKKPLCEIYIFIKNTIKKDKTKWSVTHTIHTNGFPCKCSWVILGDNENVTKLSSSVLNIYNVETDIELREL